ncbi:ATP-binding cassette domain-containing protein [Kribbella sp. NPDC002412]
MTSRSLAATGLLLAVLAEVCSVGLLGLSGWFIAASAVAGAGAYSAFSYLAPSGGVRAFALGRIAAGCANRVVLHAAALRRISGARLAVYDQAAASEGGGWSGQSLDRVMADADTTGMAVIQATAPVVVATAMAAGGCVAIVLVGYPLAALTLAAAVVTCAVLAMASARRPDDITRIRGRLRNELVTAVEAWPEMASLGATDQLAQRTLQRVNAFEAGRTCQAATTARALGGTRAVTTAALLLTVLLTVRSGATIASLVFVGLLTAGVLVNAERLVTAVSAWVQSRQAVAHLASVGEDETGRPVATCRVTYDGRGLTVSGYQLPETPTRDAREIAFAVAAGGTVVLTGPSGSGKTTLMTAIATALRRQPGPAVVTAVLADDYLFTGTVADNLRLANPAATDAEVADLVTAMSLDSAGVGPQTTVGVGGRKLSGGEQRRLHLARALATRPDILLIDEPTTGLDPETAGQVLHAVRRRLPHAILILTMHQPPPALQPLTTIPLG